MRAGTFLRLRHDVSSPVAALVFYLLSSYVNAHPMPIDDLLRPEIRVITREPFDVRVILRPRANVASATVETPNNANGRLLQCEFGALVANQIYECRVTGAAGAADPAFAINVNGVLVESDGHSHYSSRGLAVPNPNFDLERYRSERRREAAELKTAGRTERTNPKKN
jgi:hypothetical protein